MAVGVTVTGFDDYKRGLQAMPGVVRPALRGVASMVSERIARDIRDEYRGRNWQLANEVEVRDDTANQAFVVSVNPKPPRPANLPLWWEYGTRKLGARPAMTQAILRHRSSYVSLQEAALQQAFNQTVNR